MLVDQFQALSLSDQVATIKAFKAIVAEKRQAFKASKEAQKAQKAEQKLARQAAAIAKAQARLQKLLEKQAAPVGVKALKANRKPSKVTTYGAEDNAIASAILAKKASA
jgi:hypothetical protein